MKNLKRLGWGVMLLVAVGAAAPSPMVFDVRSFGAKGDGISLDTAGINRAIDAANAAGGGEVRFPAGNYLSVSIHLKSNVAIYLDQGATIVAADQGYDLPEANPKGLPNPKKAYQDFGHSHWHNSLIWGEGVENVSILGPGRIWGKGLAREQVKTGSEDGVGNKTIALKLCRNVLLRDFTIQHGGWFGVLATGVDNCTIDNVKMDTNRDGIDLDCCRHIRVSDCSINSPRDDGICPKSSFALGEFRPCEDITITNCAVSGFDEGTFLDGTYQRRGKHIPTGRIKFGTESNGGFKDITISNCTFTYCRGLALEAVDGAVMEDVVISNLTMRDIVNAPIFIRLGKRMRGPAETPVGVIRRVSISNVICSNSTNKQGILIAGLVDHPIEDLTLSNIHIYSQGGAPAKFAEAHPTEQETAYPEPEEFGALPAYGLYARHVRHLSCSNMELRVEEPDSRTAIFFDDVKEATLTDIHVETTPVYQFHDVDDIDLHRVHGVADVHQDKMDEGKL
ncbi:MAG TPA: glycoside hydrolase family 28 protein [Tepidisphaeraceae bacterium]|nr:glycoside hydrolase family 28 protein [Tepidisphaeraceae bacterium]